MELFQSADAMRKLLSQLDFGLADDSWIEDHSHIFGTSYYRDISKCILFRLAHLQFQVHLHFEPVSLAESENCRIYCNLSTGDWCWGTQDQLPAWATIVLDPSWRRGRRTSTYSAAAILVMGILTSLFMYLTCTQEVEWLRLCHSTLTQRHVMSALETHHTLIHGSIKTVLLHHKESNHNLCRARPKQSSKPRVPPKWLSSQEAKELRSRSLSRAAAWTGLSPSALPISCWLLPQRKSVQLLWWEPAGGYHALRDSRRKPANCRVKQDFLDLSITTGGSSSSSLSPSLLSFQSLEPPDPSFVLQNYCWNCHPWNYHRNYVPWNHCWLLGVVSWLWELMRLVPIVPVSSRHPAPRCLYRCDHLESHSVLCIICPSIHLLTDDPVWQHLYWTGINLQSVVPRQQNLLDLGCHISWISSHSRWQSINPYL